ncbi:MAG: hypothetical protein WCD89_23630 [Anaerocolumna sp.]
MNIILINTEEAKEYINEIKGYIIAELMFSQLMKQPEQIRIRLYEMLTQKEGTRSSNMD